MSEPTYRGTVSFVHYEKHFATIDYAPKGKTKSVNCKTLEPEGNKKPRYFRVGDEVEFQLRLSDRGDKMTAHAVKFLFNPALERLVQKAAHENRFSGYIKKVGDELFIKEVESYLFFPLLLSPWQTHPSELSFNTPVSFQLVNLDKPKNISAALYFPVFIPEYKKAQQAMESKTAVKAAVTKVSPYACYVALFGGKMESKISLPAAGLEGVKEGDELLVHVKHLTPQRMVVATVV